MSSPIRIMVLLLSAALLGGCRGRVTDEPPVHLNPNMDDQEKLDPQEEFSFFPDGRASREPVAGTIARGDLQVDTVRYEGQTAAGNWIQHGPLPTTEELLRRGQRQFNIYCAPCHDRVGTGRGMVTNYAGMTPPTNLQDARIREMPDGQIFHTITYGVRTMPSYRHQVGATDRWAIVAYLRALQRSQSTTLADVPSDMRSTLEVRP